MYSYWGWKVRATMHRLVPGGLEVNPSNCATTNVAGSTSWESVLFRRVELLDRSREELGFLKIKSV